MVNLLDNPVNYYEYITHLLNHLQYSLKKGIERADDGQY